MCRCSSNVSSVELGCDEFLMRVDTDAGTVCPTLVLALS